MSVPNSKDLNQVKPDWAMVPFKEYLETSRRLLMVLHLSKKGMATLRGIPGMITALETVEGLRGEDEEWPNIEEARKEADFAQRELDEDFPFLHAQATIAMWSALEATVRLFVARVLQHEPRAMDVEAIQKVKVKLGEYERLKGEDRFYYIIDKLEQELSAPLRAGINRFEIILEPFGFGGDAKEEIRRNLFEMNQIRNALVHRAAVADRRLVDSCPSLGLEVGHKVKLTEEQFERYSASAAEYVLSIVVRIGEYYGRDMSQFK